MLIISCINYIYIFILHIVFHAYSKARIFMLARFFIHNNNNLQDKRTMFNKSSLKNIIAFISLLLCIISIIRLIYISCFISKEKLLVKSDFNYIRIFRLTRIICLCITTIIYNYSIIQMTNNNTSVDLIYYYSKKFL